MRVHPNDVITLHGNYWQSLEHRGGWVRVTRGVAWSTHRISRSTPWWDLDTLVAQARIRACTLVLNREPVFTHESALIIHGIHYWGRNPTIRVNVQGRYHRREFPALQIHGHTVPATTAQESLRALPSECIEEIDGLKTTTLPLTAVQMALDQPPLEAIVAISAILRKMTQFDRFSMEEARRREDCAKATVLDLLAGLNPRSGITRAETIIRCSSAACESVAERALLWILMTLCPDQIVSQHEVIINRRRYFLDFAIPGVGAGFEFDGAKKMGETDEEFDQRKREFLSRQRDLVNAGWQFFRVTWEDFQDFEHLRDRIEAFLRRIGVSLHSVSVQGTTRTLWSW